MQGTRGFCTNELAVIGKGGRRVCYRMREPGLCAKFYRLPDELPRDASLRHRSHLQLARFSRSRNLNCREHTYLAELRRRLPEDLLGVFPERVEPLFCPERGWGLLESLIVNPDGSPARKLSREIRTIRDPALRRRACEEARRLLERLADHRVRFFDPGNLLLQWTGADAFRLRIADFEPCGREFLPQLLACPWAVGCKVRRRARRYLARLRRLAGLEPEACDSRLRLPPVSRFAFRFARAAGLI